MRGNYVTLRLGVKKDPVLGLGCQKVQSCSSSCCTEGSCSAEQLQQKEGMKKL